MIKLMAILIGLLIFSRLVFPADETNKTPPAAADERTFDAGTQLPALGEAQPSARLRQGRASPASPIRLSRDFPPLARLRNTSAERAQRGERDPFWPIGYVPPSRPGSTVAPAKTNATEFVKETTSPVSSLSGMLKIGGVIRSGGKFYATINGFTVQTGEVVTAIADGEVYKFIIEKIDFEKVQVKPIGR